MPYCSQCGNQVGTGDVYCAKCGTRQPVIDPPPPVDPLATMTPRTASMLCYIPVVGWIAAIILLAADRFRQNLQVRFHAFQGLYLFVAWLMVHQVLRPVFRDFPDAGFVPLDRILEAVIMFTWIFMLVKTSHEQEYTLPVIGDLARKSAAER
jgi:uncharacterized membrane protein